MDADRLISLSAMILVIVSIVVLETGVAVVVVAMKVVRGGEVGLVALITGVGSC